MIVEIRMCGRVDIATVVLVELRKLGRLVVLASQTDVEQRLQIDFTNNADPVCASLIAAAQGHIEREVGRAVEAAARTETLDWPPSSYLWLKWTPVNSITSVVVDGTTLVAVTDYIFEPTSGRVARVSSGYLTGWSVYKPASVVVTYNGGYVTVPLDLRDICATSAARAFQIGAAYAAMPAAGASGAVQSITLAGSDSVTFGTLHSSAEMVSLTAGYAGLTDKEVMACRYYRHAAVA